MARASKTTAKAKALSPAKATAKATKKAPVKRVSPVSRVAKTAKAAKATKAAPAPRVPKKAAAPAKTPAKPVAKAAPARKKVLDKFMLEQRALLQEERDAYVEQAESLKAEADLLAAEMEPGDIQFDEESGEGGTTNIDRERDLALSAQARAAVEEIDAALAKIVVGTYGICEGCGHSIPRARLKALPYARLCVACKSGGLSRR